MNVAATFLIAACLRASVAGSDLPMSLAGFHPERRDAQIAYETALNSVPQSARLRAHHEMLCQEPHVAGSEGDHRTIERLAAYFEGLGLEVQTQWLSVYLSRPISAELSIVEAPAVHAFAGSLGAIGPDSPLLLGTTEPPLAEDLATQDPRLPIAFNAFSASGDVTARVVYANYGTKADFQTLRAAGVDVKGAIVLARYGGNYRGFKARYAQDAGAVGLIMYSDPGDSGYARGPTYPGGGWAGPHQVQRGSIVTMDRPGDPLTPGIAAVEDLPDDQRLDPDTLDLPRIPVQPVGWDAAARILERMTGRPVAETPGCERWQGALPLTYRIDGGDGLRVRLAVEQERGLVRTANVVATLRGSTHPEQKVIVGCHHDAWGFGAGDPMAGLMLILESARSFAELAARGERPERSILFCAWGAEEYGIVGSTEWVEANLDDLSENGIAYLNLDMATMGDNFWASASPSLKSLIIDAAKAVPHCRQLHDERTTSVHDDWLARTGRGEPTSLEPTMGTLGGGSDHVAFYCHAGIPSMAIGSSGARGSSYHSNYDTLTWYHAVVGDDYRPAVMNTRMANVLLARLARADIVPLDFSRYASDLEPQVRALTGRLEAAGLEREARMLAAKAKALSASNDVLNSALRAATTPQQFEPLIGADAMLRLMERRLIAPEGLPGRPFFRSVWAAPDSTSGYSAWLLPGIVGALEAEDPQALGRAVEQLDRAITGLMQARDAIASQIAQREAGAAR